MNIFTIRSERAWIAKILVTAVDGAGTVPPLLIALLLHNAVVGGVASPLVVRIAGAKRRT
jgi:hypothetical protein